MFDGFTTETTDGNAGGRAQMHSMCAAEFTDSHLCHVSEYHLANSSTPVPVGGAWLDISAAAAGTGGMSYFTTYSLASPDAGRYTATSTIDNCMNWTNNLSYTEGLVIRTEGPSNSNADASCDVARPLACCGSVFLEAFAGFTTAVTDGNIGGRANAHFICGSEFPGSHLCHVAEYYRTNSAIDPPGGGAWLDISAVRDYFNGGTNSCYGIASVEAGRYATASTIDNCMNWTNNMISTEGLVVLLDGPSNSNTDASCDVVRPLACCW